MVLSLILVLKISLPLTDPSRSKSGIAHLL